MNTRFGRAFRYEIKNYFRAVAVLWLVMALLPAAQRAKSRTAKRLNSSSSLHSMGTVSYTHLTLPTTERV